MAKTRMLTSAGERQIIKLDKLSDRPMVNNKVLVKVDFVPEDDFVLNSGIILAGSEYNEAAHVSRFGTVVKAPTRLITRFNEEPTREFEPIEWETAIEVSEGDEVYFGVMASANAPVLEVGEEMYFLINYGDLILRIRDGEIYPLNGYVLMEEVIEKTRVSGLVLDFGDFQNKRLGVVKYVGAPNACYFGSDLVDADVSVGDTVILNGKYWTNLEEKTFAKLDKLGYSQRCWIIGKE